MATLTFTGSRPTPRQKSVLVVGQVNAEPITVVVDDSWSGLQLELQFFHSVTHPEVPVVHILDETMTCNVPPEVTKEVGVVHVALAGRDSGTIIKLSEKLYYADAKIGADPQGGLTPEQQTPDYIAQMIAIQEETKAVAQSVRTDADNGLFDGEPGKSPTIKNGNWWIWDVEDQEYRDTGVAASGGGAGGTTDYTALTNKPKINGVELSGNKTAQELNLQPKGDYANKTDIPTKLPAPYTLTFAGAVEATYDGSEEKTVTIPTVAGPPGATPNIQIGTVTTLEPGQQATASVTGTPENPLFNFGIPRGKDGAGGGVEPPLPTLTPEDANKCLRVNEDGNGYVVSSGREMWDELTAINLQSDVLVYYICLLKEYDLLVLQWDNSFDDSRDPILIKFRLRDSSDRTKWWYTSVTADLRFMHIDITHSLTVIGTQLLVGANINYGNNPDFQENNNFKETALLRRDIGASDLESSYVTMEFDSLSEEQLTGLSKIRVFARRRV